MAEFNIFHPLENVILKFTEDQLGEIINFFDENCKPLLLINDLPNDAITIDQMRSFLELKKIHRRSFHYPSYAEIMTEAEKLKAGVTRMLTKDQFIYLLNEWVVESEIKHELKLAFEIFDTEKRSFLEIDEIRTIVTNYGDVFNKAETIEMLRDANVHGDGNVFYEEFIESLFSLAPELNNMKTPYLYDNAEEDPSVPSEPIVIEEVLPPPPLPPPPPQPPKEKGKKKK